MNTCIRAVRGRLRSEEGWAVVTAILLTAIMMGIGLSTFAYVDGEQRRASDERLQESSFNLGEASLELQAVLVGKDWPTAAAFPVCSGNLVATQTNVRCPDAYGELRSRFTTPDYGQSAWTTTVRDNVAPGQNAWHPSIMGTGANARPAYDQNADNRVWLHSTTTVSGERRTVVAQVERRQVPTVAATYALRAAAFTTTDSRSTPKYIEAPTATTAVKCTLPAGQTQANCLKYLDGNGVSQVNGTVQPGWVGGNALTDAEVASYRTTAQNASPTRYYSSCPATLPTAPVVYIRSASGSKCEFTNGTVNTQANPGILIIENGKLELKGNFKFFGAIYVLNRNNSPDLDVVKTADSAQIVGYVAIDGPGGFQAGSYVTNIIFDPTVLTSQVTSSYAGASIRKGTWREVAGG